MMLHVKMEGLVGELSMAAAELQEETARVDRDYKIEFSKLQELRLKNDQRKVACKQIKADIGTAKLELQAVAAETDQTLRQLETVKSNAAALLVKSVGVQQSLTSVIEEPTTIQQRVASYRRQLEDWKKRWLSEGRQKALLDQVVLERQTLTKLRSHLQELPKPVQEAAKQSALKERLEELAKRCKQVKEETLVLSTRQNEEIFLLSAEKEKERTEDEILFVKNELEELRKEVNMKNFENESLVVLNCSALHGSPGVNVLITNDENNDGNLPNDSIMKSSGTIEKSNAEASCVWANCSITSGNESNSTYHTMIDTSQIHVKELEDAELAVKKRLHAKQLHRLKLLQEVEFLEDKVRQLKLKLEN